MSKVEPRNARDEDAEAGDRRRNAFQMLGDRSSTESLACRALGHQSIPKLIQERGRLCIDHSNLASTFVVNGYPAASQVC